MNGRLNNSDHGPARGSPIGLSLAHLDGLRVTIVGLAREGSALARFLASRRARVTVTDVKSSEALAEPMRGLSGWPIHWVLGGHPESVLEADVVFVSPGVPGEIPLLAEARRRGLLLTSEPRLFAALCPAPIIAITGSSGKTTTTTLVGEILRRAGCRVWVGGNIGEPLISVVEEMTPSDQVVAELSSFQLEYFVPQPAACPPTGWEDLARGYSPQVAALLNITPNHLDRHPSMAAYIEAKSQIYRHQQTDDVCVMGLAVWRQLCACPRPDQDQAQRPIAGRLLLFSMDGEVAQGAFLRDGWVTLRLNGEETSVCPAEDIQLRGQHNVANVLAACAIAAAAGAPAEAMCEAIVAFRGVPHRLEFVGELHGVRYYNDSIATSPERACAALRSFAEPIVLLAGGRDKHLPWSEFAQLASSRARHVVCFGEAAELIASELSAWAPSCASGDDLCQVVSTLEDAVAMAASKARPGDVVLLAPGCTSFDAFRDFEERGQRFRELVASMGARSDSAVTPDGPLTELDVEA